MPRNKKKADMIKSVEFHIAGALTALGFDTKGDPDFKNTPKRVAKLWYEEFRNEKPATKRMLGAFPGGYKQMVTLRDHLTWSRCPHHLERVRVVVNISYIPDKLCLGLSKLGRIANYYFSQLILQEDATDKIAEAIIDIVKPKGVAVFVKGEHLCMQSRGVMTTGHVITTALRGVYMEEDKAREEFMLLCAGGKM